MISPEIANIPTVCIASSLSLQPLQGNKWCEESKERISQFSRLHNAKFRLTIRNRIGTNHWVQVTASDNNDSLDNYLSKFAISVDEYFFSLYSSPPNLHLSVGKSANIYVTYIKDWNNFYCQLTEYTRDLDWMTER